MNQSERERLEALLCAYVLGEASESERAEVERALEGDAELREERARLESTVALVQGAYAGGETLSDASVRELTDAARNGGGRVIQGPWHRRASFRAAAAVLVALTAYGAFRTLGGSSEKALPGDDFLARLEADREEEPPAPEPEFTREAPPTRLSKGSAQDGSANTRVAPDPAASDQYEAGVALRAEAPGSEGAPVDHSAMPEKATGALERLAQADGGELNVLADSESVSYAEPVRLDGAPGKALDVGVSANSVTESRDRIAGAGGAYSGPNAAAPPAEAVPGSKEAKVRGRGKKERAALQSLGTPAGGPSSPGPAGPSTLVPRTSAQPSANPTATTAAGRPSEERAYDAPGGSDEFFLGHGRLDERQALEGFFDEITGEDDLDDVAFDLELRKRVLFEDDARGGRRALGPAELDAEVQRTCGLIFGSCVPRRDESPRDMFFRYWGDNPFVYASLDAQSTFAADVDTSSYVLVRNYLRNAHLPTKDQVRTEEFVNYFRPDVPPPTEGVFRIETQLAPSRFSDQPDRWMLRVAVRGREVAREERQPLNLTFVTDTSGSMAHGGRMELVKHALRLLVAELDARDSIAIIGFSNEARLILPMTSAANRGIIESAIFGMNPDGGTNAEAGLMMGYEVAGAALSAGSHNRVVLLSDGVANIGEVDQNRINDNVRGQRARGIYLNTIGVGMDNHNDVFLEQLANKGDGLANYIDDEKEARRALVENFTGAFEPIARDVKIQVEFDPNLVYRYRQLGYENRAIADADFRNDAVDAGEIGAGHQVVCLYELELGPLPATGRFGDLGTVRLRYKQPTGAGRDPLEDSATEISHVVRGSDAAGFEGASQGYRRSVLAAQFAEVLRRSVHARGDSLDELIAESEKLASRLGDPDFTEMTDLMKICRTAILTRYGRRTELEDCVDRLRSHYLERAEREALGRMDEVPDAEAAAKLRIELEREIEALVRRRLESEQKELIGDRR